MRKQLTRSILKNPIKFAHKLGFTKLGKLHNEWIRWMVFKREDFTLMAHRNSYKTTCVSIALALIIIFKPNERTLFVRKTDDDVKEIIAQVKNILIHPITQAIVQTIYGCKLILNVDNATEISTNLNDDIKGTSQLIGMGIGTSLTGKHFDNIFTDDIVTLKDLQSKAERERIKDAYQELINLKLKAERMGRIFNTGTPWHKDDAFSLMPPAVKYDWKKTGIMTEEEIEEKKSTMTASRFAINYELRHIASEDVMFIDPKYEKETTKAMRGIGHLDSAYDGSDYTALTMVCKKADKYYVYGRMWRKHVQECYNDIITIYSKFLPNAIYTEDNGDKGFVARDLKNHGLRTHTYHESTNKFVKISTILKAEWEKIRFVEGTDEEYIQQILDYNEFVDHDDAADSLASAIRRLYRY